MDTLKKFLIYILILVGIFVLSDFLINVGLNSTYKDIDRVDNNSAVTIYQADATYVNGRIRGLINNTETISDKYLKIELYTKRDVLVGNYYLEIQHDAVNNTQAIEVLFKATDVSYYKVVTTNEKDGNSELEILPKEWTQGEVILVTILTMLLLI